MMNPAMSFVVHFKQGDVNFHLSLENGHIQRYTWSRKRHCNAEYELHIILQGACVLDVEDSQHELLTGQGILIAPGKYHMPHSLHGEFERISLGFTLSDPELSAALKAAVPQSVCLSLSDAFLDACKRFIHETNHKHPFKDILQQAMLTEMAAYLFRTLHLAEYDDSGSQQTFFAERTNLIDNYFERNFAVNGGCTELAQQLHLSTRQLNRVLKEHYGMGFQEKLMQAKMDQAALLLRTTDMLVQDIINFVGYNSPTSFYKAFHAHFQVTPKQYRAQTK